MVLVVLGVDALDPDLVDSDKHPNLALSSYKSINTIDSHTGEPSTHELWPTIITGLTPDEHGVQLTDGVAWENSFLRYGSLFANHLIPNGLQTKIGGWLLTNTTQDAFRTPASYYESNGIETLFEERQAMPIGIPNYVVDSNSDDREHSLRRSLGDLFERDQTATGGHRSSDPYKFYEQCMEMAMIRIARARRALRGRSHELVFSYTSGLDLIGHVSYELENLQGRSYREIDEFIGELRKDLHDQDELVIISDHGLQKGIHTHEAMVSSTKPSIVERITCVTDFKEAIDSELETNDHVPSSDDRVDRLSSSRQTEAVHDQLEDLGYL